MMGPVKARMTAAALAAVVLLVGAASAWAAFVIEGSSYTVGDDPLSLNAADFNGDGRPDVATINGTSSNVSVFLRQAGGGFAQEAGSPVAVGPGPSGAAVGDYNGDGRADLAVSNFVAPGRAGAAGRDAITLDGSLPDQLVRDLIEDSYDLVVSALPRRVREQLLRR